MQNNYPLSISVWLLTDDYEYSSNPNEISATALLNPIKKVILSRRIAESLTKVQDLESLVPSRMGTAIHDSIEKAWLNNKIKDTLIELGTPEKVISNILINPKKEDLSENTIPIYMEQRTNKEILGYIVTGKYDFVENGVLEDFKSTSVFAWINKSNAEKFRLQGSIYKWLNPNIITEDYMYVRYIFTDWSKSEAMKDKNYPQNRILSEKYNLLSIRETEEFIKNILLRIEKYKNSSEEDIPPCSKEDLWQKDSIFKYYKNPDKLTRSTKNFNTYAEAHDRYLDDGSVGIVREVKGEIKRCNYCNAMSICKQAQGYLDEGLL